MELLLIVIVLYLSQSIFLFWGILRAKNPQYSQQLDVSVIVAARNEADNILNCLKSLAQLDYPRSKVEFIIVNDRSEDETGNIIKMFITKHPHFKYIQITESHPLLSGKASAISRAIKDCNGEIIFITDADCIVTPKWLAEAVTYFGDNVGVLAGFTLIKSPSKKTSIFANIQALDWFYLLAVAAGAVGWNLPLSCIGNNFAFRRKAYQDVGGYEGVGFSLTEDFALLQAISENTDWQIAFPINSACLVYSKPTETSKTFVRQRKRWAVGGLKVRRYGKFIIGLGICTHLTVLLSFLFSPYLVTILAIAVIIAADLMLLIYSLKKLNQLFLICYYPLFKIFYCCYLLLLPVLLLINKKIIWKDITYT